MPKRIDEERLEPGLRLPGDLRNHVGQVLLPAGACLKEHDLPRLRAHAVNGLFGDRDWPDEYTYEFPRAGIPAHSTRRGRAQPALDPNSLITSSVLQNIHEQRALPRRIASSSGSMPGGVEFSGPGQLHDRLIYEILKTRPFQPLKADRRPRIARPSLQAEVDRGLRTYAEALRALRGIYAELAARQSVSLIAPRNVVIEFLDVIMLDFDWLPTLLSRIQPATEDYLSTQALNAALLSMAIAAQLGLSRRHILETAIGALLHDAGMLRGPMAIRLAPRPLTEHEWRTVHAHPDHSVQMVGDIGELSDVARIIAWQTHERGDATGYPRQLPQTRIHAYARIVAVADTYVAMISPRPYRPAYQPYQAAETILRDSRQKHFDITVVRALLDCISLFPVGSMIELDDGSVARVIRANTGQPTRPIIEIADRPVDLTVESHRRVVRVLQ